MRKLRQHLLIIMGMLVPAGMGALAQVGAIKGSVLDEQTGKSIQGATVFLEKTSYGTAADASGNYIIDRIPQGSYTLVVSLVGYRQSRQAVTVKPDEVLTIVVRLKTGEVTLSPVVITAIGTEAERGKLGTSVSSVEGSSINRTGAHDVVATALPSQAEEWQHELAPYLWGAGMDGVAGVANVACGRRRQLRRHP